jgi:glyoxylase I family protein
MTGPLNVRWSHVGLNCRDQAATEDFYTRWFGFRRARVVQDGDLQVIFLRNGDFLLELFATQQRPMFSPTKDGPDNPGTVRHLAFQVDDVAEFLDKVGHSLPISLGPRSFDSVIPRWRTVWVTDPDGVVVEVSQGYVDQSSAELARYEKPKERSPTQTVERTT